MRENIGFIIACVLVWACALAVWLIGDSDAGFLLSLLLVPVTLIGLVVLFGVAVVSFFLRPQLPLAKRAVPLWFATVPILLFAIVGTIRTEMHDRNTWLTIQQYDFHGSANFTFLKNGEYESWSDSPLGRSAEEGGRYERQDSILVLHPASGGTLKLAIRPYAEFKRQRNTPHIKLVTLEPR